MDCTEEVVIRLGALDDEARRAYAAAFRPGKTDTSRGLNTMDEALKGAQFFDVMAGERVVGRYALRTAVRPNGVEVHVVAAVGHLPGADLVASIEPFIAAQCEGAEAITINTRRRGLVRKLQRQGWTVDAVVMRKML